MEPNRHLRPCSGSRFAPAHVHIGDKEDIQALITSPEPRNHCAAGDIPVPPGTFLYRRGQSTPSGTEFLSPNAHLVPARDNTHPAAQNVPGHSRTPPPGDTPHRRGHSTPSGAFDAVGDRIPVPQRASCPRPRQHAPSRAERPRPLEDAPTRRHPAPAGTLQYRRGHSCTDGDNRRRRGPNSCPPTRLLSPPETTRTQPRRMSPAGAPEAVQDDVGGAGRPVAGTGRRPVGCGRAC